MNDYILRYAQGPFAGRVDYWAEAPHYFSQLHSGIIAAMLSQIWQPLLEKGCIASKEASLQIAEMRKPDIAVQIVTDKPDKPLDYAAAAAAAILAEPGIEVELEEPELQAIHIRRADSNALVTVVEIISPRNKALLPDMLKYQESSQHLFLEQGINVVEIDLTRSVKRLVEHTLTTRHFYHIAVFIPGEPLHIIPMDDEPLKRCALPLIDDVVGVELQAAYDLAYREATIAPQIEANGHYTLDDLPFPTLLTDEQRQKAMETVHNWRAELEQLRHS